MKVELIYDADCPNAVSARSALIQALNKTGVCARWREWDRLAPDSPEYVRAYGSPTILVEGEDLAGVAAAAGTRACRVYEDERGNLSGIPSVEAICSALRRAADAPAKSRSQAVVASLPAIGVALLPKLTCPLCFPAYAALLSALGIGFIDYTPYLLPTTLAFLAISLGVLAFQSRRRGRFWPIVIGVAASTLILYAKFRLDSDWLTGAGVVLLIIAVVFATRTGSRRSDGCSTCATPPGEAPSRPN